MTKAFVSYHHANDQVYYDHLARLADAYQAFENMSVRVGEIDDRLPTQTIRKIIRDSYLRDTEVTILLCGTETKFRKHVDWELKSSMIDGSLNRRSGILIIDLPTTPSDSWYADLPREKESLYSSYIGGWFPVTTKSDFECMFPCLPERLIDNLVKPDVRMSVVPWQQIERNPERLKFLVDASAREGPSNNYDVTLPMRMKNHNPAGFSNSW